MKHGTRLEGQAGVDLDRAYRSLQTSLLGYLRVIAGDMAKQDDAERAIQETLERFGRLDALVNAIGGGAGTALYPAEEYPESEWDRIVDLNLRATLLPTLYLLGTHTMADFHF